MSNVIINHNFMFYILNSKYNFITQHFQRNKFKMFNKTHNIQLHGQNPKYIFKLSMTLLLSTYNITR